MNINNSTKLNLKLVAIIFGVTMLIGIAIFSVGRLIELQQESYRYKVATLQASYGAHMESELRWLAFTAADEQKFDGVLQIAWYNSKQKNLKIVGQLLETAEDGEEKQLMGEADKALQTFIDLFENRLLPQLKKDVSQNELGATETLLAEQAAMLTVCMNKYMASLQVRSRETDAAYLSKFNLIIWLTVCAVLLTLGLGIRFILETRSYSNMLRETVRLIIINYYPRKIFWAAGAGDAGGKIHD